MNADKVVDALREMIAVMDGQLDPDVVDDLCPNARKTLAEHDAQPAQAAQPVGVADAHDIAKRVREALDRQACPDHWMVLAYEAVVSALADSQPDFDSERNVRPGDIGTEHAPSAEFVPCTCYDDVARRLCLRKNVCCRIEASAARAAEGGE